MKRWPMTYVLQRFEDAVQELATDPRPLPERLTAAVPAVVGLRGAELGSADMRATYEELLEALKSINRDRLDADGARRVIMLIVDYRDRLRAGVEDLS